MNRYLKVLLAMVISVLLITPASTRSYGSLDKAPKAAAKVTAKASTSGKPVPSSRAGNEVRSWDVGWSAPYGVAYVKNDDNETVYVGQQGDNYILHFSLDGEFIPQPHFPIGGITDIYDMTYNWNTGKIWVQNYNPDDPYTIYEVDPNTGFTGEKIVVPDDNETGYGPVGQGSYVMAGGLAYDPYYDTYFAADPNGSLMRFDATGYVLDKTAIGIQATGLAYNPWTSHLFVKDSGTGVYVLDIANGYSQVNYFDVQNFSWNGGAGLEIDCQGNLWAVDKDNVKVVQFYSGEATDLCGVSQYTIMATAGTGGSISPSGTVTVNVGESQTFTISPNANYSVEDVLVDGASVGAVRSYTFSNVSQNHSISATFVAIKTYTITASAGAGGKISPSGQVLVTSGANQKFTITANAGYEIDKVLVDGASKGDIGTYTFTTVKANHTIAASFKKLTHTITATAGEGGSITPEGEVAVVHGNNKTFTFKANTGYELASVKVDGRTVAATSSYTFNDVTANHTIVVSFVLKQFTIKASVSPTAGGTIDPAGSVTVQYGKSRTFTFKAKAGYELDSLVVDGEEILNASGSYTFKNVTDDHTIKAVFVVKQYEIVANVDGKGGTIKPSGTVYVKPGANQTFTMNPSKGYEVKTVLVDDKSMGAKTSYTFKSVDRDHTIEVTFTEVTYEIVAKAGKNGSITPTGTVKVKEGEDKKFTVQAKTGYMIDEVLVDGEPQEVPLDATKFSYIFEAVEDDHTIEATFTTITYEITAIAGTGGSIDPDGVSEVDPGTTITYEITPNAHYVIKSILVDGDPVKVARTYTFKNVRESHTIEVEFAPEIFEISAAILGGKGTVSPSGVEEVEYGQDVTYTITPAKGYKIKSVVVDGINKGAVRTYTFKRVNDDHTIDVTFTK